MCQTKAKGSREVHVLGGLSTFCGFQSFLKDGAEQATDGKSVAASAALRGVCEWVIASSGLAAQLRQHGPASNQSKQHISITISLPSVPSLPQHSMMHTTRTGHSSCSTPSHTPSPRPSPQLIHHRLQGGPVVRVVRPADLHQGGVLLEHSVRQAVGARHCLWSQGQRQAAAAQHEAHNLPRAGGGPRQLPAAPRQGGEA